MVFVTHHAFSQYESQGLTRLTKLPTTEEGLFFIFRQDVHWRRLIDLRDIPILAERFSISVCHVQHLVHFDDFALPDCNCSVVLVSNISMFDEIKLLSSSIFDESTLIFHG